MNTRQGNAGFTLLELLVALSIGTIIMSIGVPSFQNVMDNGRMTTSTNELVSGLNLARSEAIKRVAYVSMCASANGTTCGGTWNNGWIVFANASADTPASVDPGDEIIRVMTGLHEDLNLQAAGNIAGSITFRPTGTAGTTAANMSGTFTMCNEHGASRARGVLITPSGQWSVSRDYALDGSPLECP